MQITIQSSEESWKSPDGQRTIWEITDGEGNKWQTMSQQIAQAIGQTMDLTTRVSDKGKTYLIKPPVDGVRAPQAAPPSLGGQDATMMLRRILEQLEAIEKILLVAPNKTTEVPDIDLPPIESYEDDL